ncbi:MAG: hypothetical protein QW767_04840 [Thermoprotei archaeon]
MRIPGLILGGFPHGKLMRYRSELEDHKIARDKYETIVFRKIESSVRVQTRAGAAAVSDPLYEWEDMFSPYSSGSVEGVTRGTLFRFFDNNAYYRKPTVIGSIRRTGPVALTLLKKVLQFEKPGNVKAFLPGPITFMRLSENKFYSDPHAFLSDLCSLIRQEISDLVEAGIGYIELCDPALASDGFELEGAEQLYRNLIKGFERRLIVSTPFSTPSTKLLTWLDQLSLALYLDVSSTTLHAGDNVKDFEGTLSMIRNIVSNHAHIIENKTVFLGAVDSRNTLVEPPKLLAEIAECLLARDPEKLYLCTNTTLDFLPERVALKKVNRVCSVRASKSVIA